jgi:hypothetical protein
VGAGRTKVAIQDVSPDFADANLAREGSNINDLSRKYLALVRRESALEAATELRGLAWT